MINVCIDLETTHLRPTLGVIIQMTMVAYDKDFKTISQFDTYIQPYPSHFDLVKKVVSEEDTRVLSEDKLVLRKAMEINCVPIVRLEKAETAMEVRNNFITWWENDLGSEKIFPLGQNFDRFDWRFLERFFGEDHISRYFHYKSRQTDHLLQGMLDAGRFPDLEKTSLVKACQYFDIDHMSHDSFGDVHATIQLWKRLVSEI